MDNSRAMLFGVIYFILMVFLGLLVILIPMWKYTVCRHEGLSVKYCISRLF